MMNRSFFAARFMAVLGPFLLAMAGDVRAGGYDPLAVDPVVHPSHVDLTMHDAGRDRDIPVRVYLPAKTAAAPVVLFSHGLGGSRAGSAFLGEHWAARGYAAVFLQHPGSDDSVWRDTPEADRMQALKQAASLKNFIFRVEDVRAALDQLALWNADKSNSLASRLDMKKIGMSGHSFGAITTEAVSGETMPVNGQEFTDPRIQAAIIFSPSASRSLSADEAFGAVKIPWLLMTGTKDVVSIGSETVESRLSVYPALHGAPKYQVVLFNAEHSVFTERALPGDHEPRNPNHHRVILALSTAFWDAYLRGDAGALAWLNGPGPRSVMEADDQWQSSAH
jgi:predicted dienelactone hydrolase